MGFRTSTGLKFPKAELSLHNGQGTFVVESFRIARYPVTNIQFEAFVKAKDGYSSDIWWERIDRVRRLLHHDGRRIIVDGTL